MAIFATNEKLTFLDMKVYEDNIYNLLHIAEDYILKISIGETKLPDLKEKRFRRSR